MNHCNRLAMNRLTAFASVLAFSAYLSIAQCPQLLSQPTISVTDCYTQGFTPPYGVLYANVTFQVPPFSLPPPQVFFLNSPLKKPVVARGGVRPVLDEGG